MGGSGEQGGDRFGLQDPCEARWREGGQQHRRRTGRQSEMKAVEGVEVPEGGGGENPVIGGDSVFRHAEPGVSKNALVGERHALGPGRGARGIEQQEWVGSDRAIRQIVRRGRGSFGEGASPVGCVAENDDMLQRRDSLPQVERGLRGFEISHRVQTDEGASVRVGQERFHLGRAVGHVEGRHDSADRADRQVAHEILRAVGQLHRNDVARAEAKRFQSPGKRRHSPGQLCVGQTLSVADDRRRVRRFRRRPGDPL